MRAHVLLSHSMAHAACCELHAAVACATPLGKSYVRLWTRWGLTEEESMSQFLVIQRCLRAIDDCRIAATGQANRGLHWQPRSHDTACSRNPTHGSRRGACVSCNVPSPTAGTMWYELSTVLAGPVAHLEEVCDGHVRRAWRVRPRLRRDCHVCAGIGPTSAPGLCRWTPEVDSPHRKAVEQKCAAATHCTDGAVHDTQSRLRPRAARDAQCGADRQQAADATALQG